MGHTGRAWPTISGRARRLSHSFTLAVFVTVLALAPAVRAADDARETAGVFLEVLEESPEKAQGLSGVVRSSLLRPDPAALERLASRSSVDLDRTLISLNLFSDLRIDVELESGEDLRWGGRGWVGGVADCAVGEAFLVVRGDVLVGSVVCSDRIYQLRAAPGGLVRALELSAGDFVDDATDQVLPPLAPPVRLTLKSGYEKADSASRIDVLVGYTTAAKSSAGGADGMAALIDLAVLETNTGYANSGVTQRLRLVHAVELDYVETGSSSTDLSRLYWPSDGYLDEMHGLRDTYGADTMSLWTATSDSCGRGYLMTSVSSSFAPAAMNVVQLSCATGYYSFGHELGHNMGLRHDWYVDAALNSPYSHNKGYANPAAGWRTIMAYNTHCADAGSNCTRIQHFSNPDVSYLGAPTGVPTGTDTSCLESNLANPDCDADARLVLDATASTVANFRQTQFYATVSLAAAPETVDIGETIGYSIEVRNDTETTATGVVIEAEVPSGTTLDPSSLSVDASYEGTDAGSLISWTTGADLGSGATLTRSFDVIAAASGHVEAQASVTSSNASVAALSNTTDTTVLFHAVCGFAEGFEAGSLSAYWRRETTQNGRVSVLGSVPDSGSYSAVLDASEAGVYSGAAMIVTADLAGSGEAQLSFRWRDFGDEYDSAYDGVFVREDGSSSWHKVFDFEGTYHDAYQDGVVDLSAAASAAGIAVGDGFQIKFSQYDNWYINTASPGSGDGYAIDGISLICSPGEVALGETEQLSADGQDGFSWGADPNASSYNFYRGSASGLAGLVDASIDSCLRWEGSENSVSGISETPSPGGLYWFLVTGENALGEGGCGQNATGERQLDPSGGC